MNDQEKAFKDPRVDDITTSTGVIDERDALSIDEVDDATLVRRFKYWVNDSEAYWNSRSGFNLTQRTSTERALLPRRRIVTGFTTTRQIIGTTSYLLVSAVIAYVSARDPGCEITPETTLQLVRRWLHA